MGPKFDPNVEQVVYVRAVGGESPSPATLAPKCGPLGLAPKKIGDQIMKSTKDWKGLRITCKLTVKNRVAEVEVVPTSSALILAALKEPPRDRKKTKNIKHSGSVTFDDVLAVARTLRNKSMARTFKGTVKEILGTCRSVGCKVDGRDPADITADIDDGSKPVPEA